MSSFGKKVWSSHPQLRRQKSCVEIFASSNNLTATKLRDRKFSILQKQLSVDASSVLPSQHYPTPKDLNINNNKCASDSGKPIKNQINENIEGSSIWNNKNGECIGGSESSFKITSSSKKRPQGLNAKTDHEITERLKKALKERGNRLNLNIFLLHSTNAQDYDTVTSDTDSPLNSIILLKKDNNNDNIKNESNLIDLEPTITESTIKNTINNNNISIIKTKSTLRVNSSPTIPDNYNLPETGASIAHSKFTPTTNNIITSASDEYQRRPPLIRAMSAPIRPIIEDSTKIMQNKRKLRRKKLTLRDRDEFIDQTLIEDEEELSSNDIKLSPKNKSKSSKLLQRPRSATSGNEIVTLVSLLSSGGSDSEKEDSSKTMHEPMIVSNIRAPMLRKTGKSVSFQENDLHDNISPSTQKELPTIYRRGSVAPLANRIRSNRPPTAPPGSIYYSEFDSNNDDIMSSRSTNSSNGHSKDYDIKDSIIELRDDEEQYVFPQNVKTQKEKECWKLFQKMSNRGVSVSYDTILRGMLTPTELRVIQKQKEADEAASMLVEQLQKGEDDKNKPKGKSCGNAPNPTVIDIQDTEHKLIERKNKQRVTKKNATNAVANREDSMWVDKLLDRYIEKNGNN